jgi:hypothetical protein
MQSTDLRRRYGHERDRARDARDDGPRRPHDDDPASHDDARRLLPSLRRTPGTALRVLQKTLFSSLLSPSIIKLRTATMTALQPPEHRPETTLPRPKIQTPHQQNADICKICFKSNFFLQMCPSFRRHSNCIVIILQLFFR